MQEHPFFSVIVLNYNGKSLIEPCLSSLLNSDYPNFEIILVDNASCDGSVELAVEISKTDRRLRIIKNSSNSFYTGGNNIGINNAKGDFILILNNDTEIEKKCLRELSDALKKENIGAAQPKILIQGGHSMIDNTGGIIDFYGYTKGRGQREIDKGQFDNDEDIFYAGGTAMALKKSVLDKVGIFDAKFVAHWEDVDLSWRIRLAGYGIIFVPKAIIEHKISRTIKKFGNKANISFHIRKNRISGLIKNYNLLHLFSFLPFVLLFYLLIFLKELFFDRNMALAFTSISALLWNLKELPYILNRRKIVQGEIRAVSDRQIMRNMYNKSILLQDYFKPFFGSIWKRGLKCLSK